MPSGQHDPTAFDANSSTTPGSNSSVAANVTTLVRSLTSSGDYNCNCVVDAADYVVWRKSNGTQQEFTAWRSHFGQPAGSGTVENFDSSVMANVPNPGSQALAIAGLVCAIARLRFARRSNERIGLIRGCSCA
jgi:hypothetical protein